MYFSINILVYNLTLCPTHRNDYSFSEYDLIMPNNLFQISLAKLIE